MKKFLEPFKGIYAIVDDATHKNFGIENLLQKIVKESKIAVIQLRLKTSAFEQKRQWIDFAISLKTIRPYFLIINDEVEFLNDTNVDGAHLGQDDGDFQKIRKAFPNKILGLSTHSLAEAKVAELWGADYIGCGCLFPTSTKQNTQKLSLEELKQITKTVNIPTVGIGGITLKNQHQVFDAGCNMVAMVSSLWEAIEFSSHS